MKQSHAACLVIELSKQLREASDPDDYTSSLSSERAKDLIKKKIAAIRHRNQRERVKISEKKFLLCKSKRAKGILHDYPNICKAMEEYVEQRTIGADAWRRTGVLTFDGNKYVQEKVTYGRNQEHLQKVFQRKFSYGTVVELCVARNRRR